MHKLVAVGGVSSHIITEHNTKISWVENLDVTVPTHFGREICVEGNQLHERLKKTILAYIPEYLSEKGSFLVAQLTFVASNKAGAKVISVPISVKTRGGKVLEECFSDKAPYRIEHDVLLDHVKRRLDDAKELMGIKVPDEYLPADEDEELWRLYHSEQALIEYLWKKTALETILVKASREGMRGYPDIKAVILDVHSKYYICKFCEVSLFGVQNHEIKGSWLDKLEKILKQNGYIVPKRGLKMVTRASADIAFPRTPQKDIMKITRPLPSNNIETFRNRVILSKDFGRLKNLNQRPMDRITIFRSGAAEESSSEESSTDESAYQEKRRRII